MQEASFAHCNQNGLRVQRYGKGMKATRAKSILGKKGSIGQFLGKNEVKITIKMNFCLFFLGDIQNDCTFAGKKIQIMNATTPLSPAQYEVLNLLSVIHREDDLADLKAVIVQFLNTRLQNEIERLWENGTIDEQKVASWQQEHMRNYGRSR